MWNRWKKDKKEEAVKIGSPESGETILLFLLEKRLPDVKNYMYDKGLNVNTIYYDVEEAKIGMLVQSGICRLIIAEMGIGRFTTTEMREELSDLLGMADGKDRKITVYHSGEIIKSDNKKRKSVDWRRYKGIKDVVDSIKEYGEDYILSDYEKEELPEIDEAFRYQGREVNTEYEREWLEAPDEWELLTAINNRETETLPEYNPVY